eukprot:3936906-Rhodomonas_salina.1
MALCPIGVIPKNSAPWFRLVIDARAPNLRVSRWRSNMKSLAASAHIFRPGSVCWTRDIGKAYLCSQYMGCRPAQTRRMRADGTPYTHVG